MYDQHIWALGDEGPLGDVDLLSTAIAVEIADDLSLQLLSNRVID